MSNVSDYGDVILRPTIRDAEDVAVWFRRLDFIGLGFHPEDRFIRMVGHVPGLTTEAALSMDASMERAFAVTRDACQMASAVQTHDLPQLVGLPEGPLLALDDEPSEIDMLRAEVNRLEEEIARRQAETRMASILNSAVTA